MRHPFPLAALFAALLAAAPLSAQATIEAGMTPAQVREAFGGPARTRDADGWTYWFYSNGCPNRCGSDDVVFFQDGRVVAAVLRTRGRRFDGPRADRALEGLDPNPPSGMARDGGGEGEAGTIIIRPGGRSEGGVAPATVEGVRVTGPGERRPAARSQIREGTPGAPGSTIIRRDDNAAAGGAQPFGTGGEEARGLNARGSRANQANQAAQPVDTAIDQSRVDRERRVTPRTIPAGQPSAAQADTSLDQARIDRERQVTPRTIRPQPAPPARARPNTQRRGTEPVPNDTTRGKTGITPPGTPPRR